MPSQTQPQKTWPFWLMLVGFVIVIVTTIALVAWAMGTHVLVDLLLSSVLIILLVGLLLILFIPRWLLPRLPCSVWKYALGRLQGIVDRTKAAGLIGVEQRQVFHDRIDRYFSSITLDAYRKFQRLEINKLSRINLFAGINNSGKTTLLEAVYLLARQNDFNGLVEVVRQRGKVPYDWIDAEWFVE